tara:strand:- start:914 stop:1252 length:339 start_codon:yes stop_codon:yes gene_type:complete
MKISRKELKNLIGEAVRERESVLLESPIMSTTGKKMNAHDNYPQGKDPDGYEGQMAKKNLYHMARQADQLHDILMDDENLEPWIQDKITKAADYLEKAFKSVVYHKDNPEGR